MTGKPRIAVIVPSLMIGGTERHLLAVLPRLAARGFQIDILTTRGSGTLDGAFVGHGIAIHHPGRLARFGKLGCIVSLVLALRRLRPDIAHFFLPEAYLLGAIAALIARVPRRVMSRRSQNRYQRKYPLYSQLERQVHRTLHAVIGNSPAVCAELADEGVPAGRLGLIVNGLDIERFRPGDRTAARAALDLAADGLVMVIVANLITYKGHADLIDALASVRDRLPAGWTLLCVGRDGGQERALRTRAETAGIDGHLRWAGEQADVLPWLQSADIALLASHEEGSPNSLIEAMAAGVPVIATDVGGVSDIVVDGMCGHIVPAHSPERLAEKILDLASDEEGRHSMGRAARAQSERHFSIGACVDGYETLYDGLYGTAGTAATAPSAGKSAPVAAGRAVAGSAAAGGGIRLLLHKIKLPKLAVQAAVSLSLLAAVVALVIDRTSTPELFDTLARLHAVAIALSIAALAAGALLAAARLRLVSDDLGYPLNWRDSLAALGLGQLGSALFFQIFGQLAARSAYLSRRGLPVGAAVLMVGYERLLGLAVSVTLAMIGAWHIFGSIALELDDGGDELVKLVGGAFMAIAAGAWLGWGRTAAAGGAALIGGRPLHRLLRTTVFSIAIQLMTASAYVVLVRKFAPDVAVHSLFAATFIIMFTAALPISLAGWGVREFSAVLALGAVGVPAGPALVAAAIVGVGSLLVVVPLGTIALSSRRTSVSPPELHAPKIDYTQLLTFAIPLAVATGVFFNVHLPTEAGGLNVNLADPIALIGGALFMLTIIWQRRSLPTWRLDGFNLHILLATLALTLALLIGAARFGWTDWALTNKFLGWFVLLAYGATGALIASLLNGPRTTMLLKTFVAVGLAVAVLELALATLRSMGVELSLRVLWINASGFAANRNAFAFQIIMVVSVTLALGLRSRPTVLALGICLAALWFAGSKAGWLAAAVLFVLATWLDALSWRSAVRALLTGAALATTIEYAWVVQRLWTSDIDLLNRANLRHGNFSISDSTMAERLKSYTGGWHLFRDNPLFGAGLGGHVESERRATGTPLVIHSTLLWVAAEMGMLGSVIFMTPLVRVFRREIGRTWNQPAARLLVFAIAGFATMSLFHEMLYQRTFWLLLGAGLAWTGFGNRRADPSPGPA